MKYQRYIRRVEVVASDPKTTGAFFICPFIKFVDFHYTCISSEVKGPATKQPPYASSVYRMRKNEVPIPATPNYRHCSVLDLIVSKH